MSLNFAIARSLPAARISKPATVHEGRPPIRIFTPILPETLAVLRVGLPWSSAARQVCCWMAICRAAPERKW